ncbi:MAG: hypothetical protein AAF081_16765 [Actinomycetota bacterium]
MNSLSVPVGETHRKTGRPRTIEREARILRAVAGDGVVPLLDAAETTLTLAAGRCSVADVVAARGRLSSEEVRGVVLAAAGALARLHAGGVVHGDVKPANLLLHDGGLWLSDFDAAGAPGAIRRRNSPGRPGTATLASDDDIRALVHAAIECATGIAVDASVAWSALDLVTLGCPADLAARLAIAWRRADDAAALVAALGDGDARLPAPVAPAGADSTPTIDVNLDDWW